MSDAWKEREKAQEGAYFEKQEQEALKRLKEGGNNRRRPSPVTGEPMEQIVIDGVNVDRCPKSGGIWLDAGELEQILKNHNQVKAQSVSWLGDFLTKLTKP